jgi:SAM-dependent methyltransferase
MLYENPDLYDTLMPASPDQRNFYMALAQHYSGPLLELACGSGQLIVPIAAAGFSAIGLDSSAEMLEAAKRRAAASGAQVRWVHGDMRNFDLGERFPLIFVARNSLLHLSEPEDFGAFFSSVRRHLNPGGVLAFDIFNPSLPMLCRRAGERSRLMEKEVPPYGRITVEVTMDYDACSQVNRATWFISTPEKQDAWVVPLHLRSIFPQELRVLLAANGFHLMKRDGDYSGGSFRSASSIQVCLCQAT